MSACSPSWSVSVTATRPRTWSTRRLPGPVLVAHGQQPSSAGRVGGPHGAEREHLAVAAAPPGSAGAGSRHVADLPTAGGTSDSSVDPRIMAALLRLPGRQRQVVALRLFLDLDTGRSAEVLGVAPSTVKAHLARAIVALRDDLRPHLAAGEFVMNDSELITAVRITGVHSETGRGADHKPRPRDASQATGSGPGRRAGRGGRGGRGRDRADTGPAPAQQAARVSSWRPGRSSSRPTARSRSPSASCGTQRAAAQAPRPNSVPATVTFFGGTTQVVPAVPDERGPDRPGIRRPDRRGFPVTRHPSLRPAPRRRSQITPLTSSRSAHAHDRPGVRIPFVPGSSAAAGAHRASAHDGRAARPTSRGPGSAGPSRRRSRWSRTSARVAETRRAAAGGVWPG